jgi:hypothetical protein
MPFTTKCSHNRYSLQCTEQYVLKYCTVCSETSYSCEIVCSTGTNNEELEQFAAWLYSHQTKIQRSSIATPSGICEQSQWTQFVNARAEHSQIPICWSLSAWCQPYWVCVGNGGQISWTYSPREYKLPDVSNMTVNLIWLLKNQCWNTIIFTSGNAVDKCA